MALDSAFFPNVNNYPTTTDYGSLPNPDTFVGDAYNLAWPQVLAFSGAIVGILTVILILRSVTKS